MAAYGSMPDEKKMMAENDLHTLLAAEAIKKDKGRFAAAMKCRDEKMKAMQAIKKDGESK
jgi:hypothetical protein